MRTVSASGVFIEPEARSCIGTEAAKCYFSCIGPISHSLSSLPPKSPYYSLSCCVFKKLTAVNSLHVKKTNIIRNNINIFLPIITNTRV